MWVEFYADELVKQLEEKDLQVGMEYK